MKAGVVNLFRVSRKCYEKRREYGLEYADISIPGELNGLERGRVFR